jgi:hypothetical protein
MAQTFCEKIPLHRQLPDFLIQRRKLGRRRRRAVLAIGVAAREQRGRSFQQSLLPRMDLAGVHTEPARQFRNSAFLTYRRQCDFRLELSAVLLPSIGHVSPPADRPF